MFMYLELYVKDNEIEARVVNRPKNVSLGTENSRLSHSPFAVFQIKSFSGMEYINDNDLWTELFSRSTTKELWNRIAPYITANDLMRELLKRAGECNG